MQLTKTLSSRRVPILLPIVAGLFLFAGIVTPAHADSIYSTCDNSPFTPHTTGFTPEAACPQTSGNPLTFFGLQIFSGTDDMNPDSYATSTVPSYISFELDNNSGTVHTVKSCVLNTQTTSGGYMVLQPSAPFSVPNNTGGPSGIFVQVGITLDSACETGVAGSDTGTFGGHLNSPYLDKYWYWGPPPPPAMPFYAQITNTSAGSAILYDASSTSANQLKQLPNDWTLYVSSTTDAIGNPIVADGYQWYQVTDPTDGVSGWMEGEDASNTVQYLPYKAPQQTNLETISSTTIATTTDRAATILEAFDHYYNNSSTTDSLYSSDDHGATISSLKDDGFPEEILPGIAINEDGTAGNDFNNENVSFDYGHGIMQITPYHLFSNEPLSTNNWMTFDGDNRGYVSGIRIYPCTANYSESYADCYTYGGMHDSLHGAKSYQPYGGVSGEPEYKYYANTVQSIYANIKDGLQILADKLPTYSYITSGITTDGYTFSADDRKTILAIANYNGGDCGYIGEVADDLDDVNTYFPTATTSDISNLIPKMHAVGTSTVCADLESPGNISIQDSEGKIDGVVNGQGVDDFPFAVYDKTQKFAEILDASTTDDYKFRVEGTASATYGINITIKNGDQEVVFHGKDIPTNLGEIHTYTINKQALLSGSPNAVTIQIDTKGDGIVDKIVKTGAILTGAEFLANQQSSNIPTQIEPTESTSPNDLSNIIPPTDQSESASTTTTSTDESVVPELNT